MAHVWEPLRVTHKPLLVYLGAEAAARAAQALLWLMGFRGLRQGRFTCWVALPPAAAAAAAPEAGGGPTQQQQAGLAGGGAAAEQQGPPAGAASPAGTRWLFSEDSAAGLVLEGEEDEAGVQEEEEEGAGERAVPAAAAAGQLAASAPEEAAVPLSAWPRSPRVLQRHSAAAEAVHHAAEQALDGVLDVTSTMSAAVAAQHPHAGSLPVSPRPVTALAASAGSFSARAGGIVGGASAGAGSGAAGAAGSGGGSGGTKCAASPQPRLRRGKGDSAVDYPEVAQADSVQVAAGPGRAAAAAAEEAAVAAQRPAPVEGPQPPAGSSGSSGSSFIINDRGRASSTRSDVPIVFIHGVGVGVLPYLHLVREIMKACSQSPGERKGGDPGCVALHVGCHWLWPCMRTGAPLHLPIHAAVAARAPAAAAAARVACGHRPRQQLSWRRRACASAAGTAVHSETPTVSLALAVGLTLSPGLPCDLLAAPPAVIMVEVPHMALRLCWEAVPVDEVAQAVAGVLRRGGYRQACLLGHSYGSFVASRFVQMYPEVRVLGVRGVVGGRGTRAGRGAPGTNACPCSGAGVGEAAGEWVSRQSGCHQQCAAPEPGS